jgi:hypothetical protein
MKTIKDLTLMIAALFAFGWTIACQKGAETGKNTTNQPAANNTAADNKNAVSQPPANTSEANKTESDKPSAGSLATPGDAYKAAYAARQKKDIGALKKALSKDALDFFTEMGKVDGKTLEDALKELADRPQAKTAETRNEKIDGNKATLEYLDEKGSWSPMEFVKEGNDWKLTIPKFDEPDKPADKPTNKPGK